MPRAAPPLAALVLAVAPLAAQGGGALFPGDTARAPAFPTAVTLSLIAGVTAGQRATRIYAPTPGTPDIACDSVTCRTEHSLTSALGLGARLQTGISPRMGFRVGFAYSAPKRKLRIPTASATLTETEHIAVLRAEAILLWRLKAQVPVYFGAGGTVTRYSPGAVAPQGGAGPDGASDVGAVILVGIDRRIKPSLGTRFEWTGYFLKPSGAGLAANEFHMKSVAFDSQFSFGLNFFLKPARRAS